MQLNWTSLMSLVEIRSAPLRVVHLQMKHPSNVREALQAMKETSFMPKSFIENIVRLIHLQVENHGIHGVNSLELKSHLGIENTAYSKQFHVHHIRRESQDFSECTHLQVASLNCSRIPLCSYHSSGNRSRSLMESALNEIFLRLYLTCKWSNLEMELFLWAFSSSIRL